MLMKNRGALIASVGLVLCLISAIYVSCTKTGLPPKCNGVLCLNGGFCDSGICKCPVGFEGANCNTAIVTKFINTYDVKQTVIGSDSSKTIGQVTNYQMILQKTATPTTFFINNFTGHADYDDIICIIDSVNSSNFMLDTVHNFHQWNDHYRMRYGTGHINPLDSSITATFMISSLNAVINWQKDTLSIVMKPHHF